MRDSASTDAAAVTVVIVGKEEILIEILFHLINSPTIHTALSLTDLCSAFPPTQSQSCS